LAEIIINPVIDYRSFISGVSGVDESPASGRGLVPVAKRR
jgi:hypothetical protein